MIKLIKREKNFLLITFFLSLTIKAIFFLIFLKNNPCLLMFDSEHYHKIALELMSGNGFAQSCGMPQFYRMPGYPVFMAACYQLFGPQPLAVLVIQILLSSLIPALIFILALTLFDKTNFTNQVSIAKLSSLAACFDLGYVIFPGLIMSEILFVLFFTIFLILFLYNYAPFFCEKEVTTANMHVFLRLFLAGIALGIACSIRPVGHAMFLLSIFMLLASKDMIAVKIKSIVAVTSGLACTLGIWILRNFLLTGYIFMHTLSGPHFLNHSAVRLCMMDEKITYEQAQNIVYKKARVLEHEKMLKLGRPLREIECCILAEKLTIYYMLKNPILTVQHFISNMLKTTFGLYSSELLVIDSGGQLPPYSNDRSIKNILKRFLLPEVNNKFIILVIYFEIIFFLFILLGFIIFTIKSIFNKQRLCILIKVIPFVGSLIFLTLSCGYARLRLPIESFLIILAIREFCSLIEPKSRPG